MPNSGQIARSGRRTHLPRYTPLAEPISSGSSGDDIRRILHRHELDSWDLALGFTVMGIGQYRDPSVTDWYPDDAPEPRTQPTADITTFAHHIEAHPLDWRDTLDADDHDAAALHTLADAIRRATDIEQTNELRARFEQLADSWSADAIGASLATHSTNHPSYRRIIGMGMPAVPLILERLAERGGQWFVALHSITDANPVPPEDRGHRAKMCEAWVAWARERNIISW